MEAEAKRRDQFGDLVDWVLDDDGSQPSRITNWPWAAVPEHDEILLGYTGELLSTVTYKLAGSTVGVRTLTYDSGRLESVVWS